MSFLKEVHRKITANVLKRTLKSISYSHLKRNNPSADRNQGPILETLKKILDTNTPNLKLLEISSGTGQHAAYFSESFPNITFQPSEYDQNIFNSISAYSEDAPYRNVNHPVLIDVSKNCEEWNLDFQSGSFDYMLNINMIHITPWTCTEGLFRNASKLLKCGGLVITYGPYAIDGNLFPESNVKFNEMLKNQNSEWGVRDLSDIRNLAKKYGIVFRESYEMPANNKIVVWKRN